MSATKMTTGNDAAAIKNELISQLRDLELRQVRRFARDRSLPLLTTTLTIQQLKVLVLLSIDGDMPAHELAEGIGVGVATLTGIVDRLAARSLVVRREDARDRRVRRIDLTEEGRALIAEMWGTGQERSWSALSALDVETLRGLVRGVAALHAAMEAQCTGDDLPS
ncbi:MarR family winged helix-turn-helix transcriptional regulator [Nocardiopsis ansamitocini]|nr:MarR family transcriptional regulator [Nocardiopsis ansamitocini]